MPPVGGLFDGVGACPPFRFGVILKPVSPLIPGVAATGLVPDQSLGLDPVSTFRSSLHSRCRCVPTCVLAVKLMLAVLPTWPAVTSSCSPGVRWTDADLRHLSRPWAQDSFIAATIMSAGPWGAQGTGIAVLPDSCPSPGGAADRSVFPVRISPHCLRKGKHPPRRARLTTNG